jgi:hypothetical protein
LLRYGDLAEAKPYRGALFVAVAAAPINQVRGSFAKDDPINVSAPSQPISPNVIIFGAQIRAARILLGCSQAQLSRRCDVLESSN